MAGSNNCDVEIKERVIKKMQADSIVGRRRALQIQAGEDESPISNPQSYPTPFRCEMDPENKKKINPWAIKKSFAQELGNKPGTIRSNESEFVIEISNEKKNRIPSTKTSLYSPQFQERVKV